MIRHTVTFRLKHPAGSPAEHDFLSTAQRLASIAGVKKFEILRQVGRKSGYTFGISMEFADTATYDHYNTHPEHVRFVQERWLAEVESDFLELDYTVYS
jgi:hypothetical protein